MLIVLIDGISVGADVLIDLLMFKIFSVKKLANSLQALVEFSSGSTVTEGVVNLSAVAINVLALLLFL